MTSISDFEQFLKTKRCRFDNRSLARAKTSLYPHEGGIYIEGYGKVWLYAVCLKCGYQWSFAKLGFPAKDPPYVGVKVANMTIDIPGKSEAEAKARWHRAEKAIDSLFVALESGNTW